MENLIDDDLEKNSSDESAGETDNILMMKWNLMMIMMNSMNNQLKAKKLF